ncbi:MAG: aminodeoxychorismate/anthranilate synthase component II [Gammaproteobacteria bacterium]|nr:aminodeoxychorismate/anthranilate synthase component II [Gammaproteobacteria bacterium]
MKICLIDNYDSFTFNLEHQLASFDIDVDVIRNDEITIKALEENHYDAFVLGPGPSNPENAGICLDLIKHFYQKKPILGVCLGHQCIGEAFGANIIKCKVIKHGKTSQINHDGASIFRNVKNPYHVMRYHSLVIKKETLDKDFIINAWITNKDEDSIMGIKHKGFNLIGIQFHTESIFTDQGAKLISNFLTLIK